MAFEVSWMGGRLAPPKKLHMQVSGTSRCGHCPASFRNDVCPTVTADNAQGLRPESIALELMPHGFKPVLHVIEGKESVNETPLWSERVPMKLRFCEMPYVSLLIHVSEDEIVIAVRQEGDCEAVHALRF